MTAPADVSFDGDGIAWIKAACERDGAAALGYVHARDRMFSMDLMRRNASGRLSEICGIATLPNDRLMRTLGLRQSAAAALTTMAAEPRAMLDAYARGVNAWIARRGRFSAAQFIVFGAPEPWSPVDSLLWTKTMSLHLGSNMRSELQRAGLAGKLPREKIDQLWPMQVDIGCNCAAAVDPDFAAMAARLDALLPKFPDPFTLPDTASNAWAVDGRHSVTGAPLLAGDPHLSYTRPGLWYLARIDTPQGVLAGATAPGLPFLVIGRNSDIGWTLTTAGVDTQDLFKEEAAAQGCYQAPGGTMPFDVHQETIRVRFRASRALTIRRTRHGPVLSDLVDPNGPIYAASIASLQPGDDAAAGLLALNRAASVMEAGVAAVQITSPVHNLVVADSRQIGQFTTGRVPVRASADQDGAWPAAGADGANDWIGWARGPCLPHVIAPPSGRLANANQRVAPPGFPVFLGRDWLGDWRARRIHELLGEGKHSVASFAAMQLDVVSLFAQSMLPILCAVPRTDDLAGRAAALLDDWNGTVTMDAPQPLIFNAWLRQVNDDVASLNGIPPGTDRPWPEFIHWVLSPAGAAWCGDNRTAMLERALQPAIAGLAAKYGQNPAAWRWGRAHVATFADPVIPLLSARIAQPGDATTLYYGAMAPGAFRSVHGPGFRGVYDLANLDRSLFMTAPGQSGRLFGVSCTNLLARWRDGGFVTLGRSPSRTAAALHLLPDRS